MRYRVELVLSFQFIAIVMAIYFVLSFKDSSPVEHPERLYREWKLMLAVGVCSASDDSVPRRQYALDRTRLTSPTAPVSGAHLQGKWIQDISEAAAECSGATGAQLVNERRVRRSRAPMRKPSHPPLLQRLPDRWSNR